MKKRNLTQNQVNVILDLHNEQETEQPLIGVLFDQLKPEDNTTVEFMDSFLDEFMEDSNNKGSDLANLIYDIQSSNTFYNTTDKWIKLVNEYPENLIVSSNYLVDLFTNQEWYEMFENASDEVMQPLLDEYENL